MYVVNHNRQLDCIHLTLKDKESLPLIVLLLKFLGMVDDENPSACVRECAAMTDFFLGAGDTNFSSYSCMSGSNGLNHISSLWIF